VITDAVTATGYHSKFSSDIYH